MSPLPVSDTAPVTVVVRAGSVAIAGTLTAPAGARGTVIFAHGSGSSRFSPRNMAVAETLQRAGFATLLMDLLTEAEAAHRDAVFDIPLLTGRLEAAAAWIRERPDLGAHPLGLFGASTGAAAALAAAADLGTSIAAVVSRGGRVDLAGDALARVTAPTLCIVGALDTPVLQLNRSALRTMTCVKELVIVPGASHLFEEPGALEEVARLAANWFNRFLGHAVPGAGA